MSLRDHVGVLRPLREGFARLSFIDRLIVGIATIASNIINWCRAGKNNYLAFDNAARNF